jgi:rod shape-determining protein MreC
MVQANRAEGVVKGSLEGDVTLDFVSRETTIKAGDVVITSGMGGVYPKGLLVGEIASASQTPSSLYQTILVAPAADLVGLEEVVVLTGAAPATQVGGGE